MRWASRTTSHRTAAPSRHLPKRPSAIVADGVEEVELVADDGTHPGDDWPRTRSSTSASGRRWGRASGEGVRDRRRRPSPRGAVRVCAVRYLGLARADARPARRPIPCGAEGRGRRIGWVLRRENRARRHPELRRLRRRFRRLEFARLVTPDPRVACASWSRSAVRPVWPPTPASARSATPSSPTAAQAAAATSSTIRSRTRRSGSASRSPRAATSTRRSSGLASDDVARLELFLATGESRPIPLRDNAWAIQAARADRPYRVVAYDREGRIIGIQDMGDNGRPRCQARRRLAHAAHGARRARAGRRGARRSLERDGGQCHEIQLPGGAGGSGCARNACRRARRSSCSTSSRAAAAPG